jgi:hypothetical protein
VTWDWIQMSMALFILATIILEALDYYKGVRYMRTPKRCDIVTLPISSERRLLKSNLSVRRVRPAAINSLGRECAESDKLTIIVEAILAFTLVIVLSILIILGGVI